MALYNLFSETLFRLRDALDRSGIYRIAAELQREQYLPRAALDELRRKRLAALLTHAHAHSPYYRDVLEAAPCPIGVDFELENLSRLPLLTRDHLQLDCQRILCLKATGHFPDASGGSTGQPVHFYHDQAYVHWAKANEILHSNWMGIRPGDRTAIFWGADRDLSDRSLYSKVMASLGRIHALNSFAMTDADIAEFLKTLNRVRPRYVYGYASSLYHISCYINSTVPLSFTPAAVKSSAEVLYDFQRREIERAFGTPVFDFYGSREVNNIAADCEAHDGLHIFESARIIELVDDRGHPVPSGQVGQIAVTDLTNRAFPFIRYLNGDLATQKNGTCSCGRTYARLEKIVGRSSDIIRVAGRQIHGEYFTHLFYHNQDIKEFQLVQESDRVFTLLVVPLHGSVDLSFFREEIEKKLGRDISLNVEVTDHIPPTAGGKHRFTISKLKHAAPGEGAR